MGVVNKPFVTLTLLAVCLTWFKLVALVVVLALFTAAAPSVLPPYWLQVAILSEISAIIAIGMNLLMGYAGQISLANASFFGMGAYLTVFAAERLHLPFLVARNPAVRIVPVCLALMFIMLTVGFRRPWIGPVIYFGVLVSASGGFLMLGWWGVNLSVAVWVGFLVLFGVVDDDGVVMSTYLEDVFEGKTFASVQEIREAVLEAGLKRIRPCLMTTATTIIGLAPIFWVAGRGSDVMRPMAIPSVGGMSVQLITLFIVPCMFSWVEEWKWKRAQARPSPPAQTVQAASP